MDEEIQQEIDRSNLAMKTKMCPLFKDCCTTNCVCFSPASFNVVDSRIIEAHCSCVMLVGQEKMYVSLE
jgi:hypothetical protein